MKFKYLTSGCLHDNPVVNRMLKKQRDGLCERAAGLATVFHEISDFDIALLLAHTALAPPYLLEEDSNAALTEHLYRTVIGRFSDESFTSSIIAWTVNAEIVNAAPDKRKAIIRLSRVYSDLDDESVDRIIEAHADPDSDSARIAKNIILSRYNTV